MAGRIVVPPAIVEVELPLVFLAGPIQGTDDWQSAAARLLQRDAAWLDIASPRDPSWSALDPGGYRRQIDWEHHYLDLAADSGVIMFWLANETVHDCSRAYAQTSRFELGEAMMRHLWLGAAVIVGIDSRFPNGRYLAYTLGKKAPAIPVFRTLEETCRRTVEIAALFAGR